MLIITGILNSTT